MTRAAPIFPIWFHGLAIASVAAGFVCALIIAVDEICRPQQMRVMAVVWPLTALYSSLIGLVFYMRFGRAPVRGGGHAHPSDVQPPPFPIAVAKSTTHCGAGCALGDIVGEWLLFGFPALAVVFGWRWLFAEKIFAAWVLDFLLAFLFGILFQYFSIQPMRHLPFRAGLLAAVKSDTISITAWQIGMYGAMALMQFLWFRAAFGALAPVASVEFWFAMQLAMLCGFMTAYPANWLLLKFKLKEMM